MNAPETAARPAGWPERLAPLGAVIFAAWLLVGFLMSEDSGDGAAELIAYAKDNETNNLVLQILALVTPILMGWFVAALAHRMRDLPDLMPRALTLIGGTLFIAFFTTAMTLWSAPLFDEDELTTAAAEAYLAFDDVGWVLLGTSGISIGIMIIGVSLAALRMQWVPGWLGLLSLVLGVASFGTVAFLGLFAWIAWLLGAGGLMLWAGFRATPRTI
jgi:hypothetical protein